MNLNKPAVIKKLQERFRNVNAGRGLYTAFLVPTMLTMFSTRAFAADTIWTKASAIMQDVYTQILGISTIAAVVTAAIALLLMNFSRSGRTVDESRAWLSSKLPIVADYQNLMHIRIIPETALPQQTRPLLVEYGKRSLLASLPHF